MKGYILKGPSREELSQAVFFGGSCVPFTIRFEGTRDEVVVMAKITDALSDGTYRDGMRNGFELKGNCYTFGENNLRRDRFEAFYNMSEVIEGDITSLGQFRRGGLGVPSTA